MMNWFNNLPSPIRHILSTLLAVFISGQAVKHGYITPDQQNVIIGQAQNAAQGG